MKRRSGYGNVLLLVAVFAFPTAALSDNSLSRAILLTCSTVKSDGMLPTLTKTDLIRPKAYGGSDLPKRGDVVVFKHPHKEAYWLKRIIGLPGDIIQMKEGRLYINRTLIFRTPIQSFAITLSSGEPIKVAAYREMLPEGVAHDILEVLGDTGFEDDTEAFSVDEKTYFMMGDNRDNSSDSRVSIKNGGIGMIAAENIVGYVDGTCGKAL